MRKVILLAGGGGHTAYAYALAHHLSGKCDIEIAVPEGDQLTADRMKKFGSIIAIIKPRGPKTSAGRFVEGLARSFRQSISAFRQKAVIVSTGSNFCIPPCVVAYLAGSDLVSIESSVRFTKASKTTRLLQPFAAITALQWEEQKRLLPRGEVFGPLLSKPESNCLDLGYVLITAGTYGHKRLFDAARFSNLENVIMQMGPYYNEEVVEWAAKNKPGWKLIDYTSNFHELISGASVVVTHFGETILDAALVYRKPVVISINEEWSRTAGIDDARMLAQRVNAVLLEKTTTASLEKALKEVRTPPVIEGGEEKLSSRILELAER